METPDRMIKYNLFDYAYYVGRRFILPWLDGSSVVFNETKWAKWYMKLLFSIFWLLLPFLIIGLIFVLSGGLE